MSDSGSVRSAKLDEGRAEAESASQHRASIKDEPLPARAVSIASSVSDDLQKPVAKKPFPKPVFFILGNEFCERFCYYGMRAVLTLYFTDMLFMSEDKATVMYHTFTMLCYFTPVFGAVIADGWLGKFWTILYLSILYAIGNIILSLSAITTFDINAGALCAVGLVVIACGTGGIKPCVSSFGGDQFDEDQERQRKLFFSIFYFCINAGSLISSFITPILRSDVHCFEEDSCYSLAFGVPAVLMIVSLIIFVAAKPLYRIVPAKGSILTEVSKCIWYALKRKRSSKKAGVKRDHWLDYADDRFGKKFVRELRAVLHIMFLYIPLPVFWSLFDQQGSRWTLQATYMDGEMGENYTLQPDQVQTINPLFILLFIPLFEGVVYPVLAKCNLLVKPLSRMFVGGMFASLAFLVAGFLQLAIEAELPANPSGGWTEMSIVNSMPYNMSVTLTSSSIGGTINESFVLSKGQVSNRAYQEQLNAVVTLVDSGVTAEFQEIEFHKDKGVTTSFLWTFDPLIEGSTDERMAMTTNLTQLREKPDGGNAGVRFVFSTDRDEVNTTYAVLRMVDETSYEVPLWVAAGAGYWTSGEGYEEMEPGSYEVYLPDQPTPMIGTTLELKNGARYTFTITERTNDTDGKKIETFVSRVQEVTPNSMNMLLQIPQYFIITVGEIMYSITGLEFSYSQAPPSMKAVLTAAWLLTSAFGNVLIIIITEIDAAEHQSTTFFVFAVIMFLVMLLFGWMSTSYVYIDTNATYDEDEEEREKRGSTNPGFVMEKSSSPNDVD